MSYLTATDVDIMYDLTCLLKNCKQVVPKQLLEHEGSKGKPGSIEFKTARKKDTIIFSKERRF